MTRALTILIALNLAACGSSLKATGTADGGPDTDGTDMIEITPLPDGDADTVPDITTEMPADVPTEPPPPGSCAPVSEIACGGSVSARNDAPGHSDVILRNGCYDNEWTGPEIAYSLTLPTDAVRATIDLTGISGDLDIFLFGQTSGACDTSECRDMGLAGADRDERMVYTGSPGETLYILIDGFEDTVSGFTLDVGCVIPEDCDDGLDNDGDTVADCEDPECRWQLPCYEDVCDDDVDNDEDGPTDCEDFDCMSMPECPEACTATTDVTCGSEFDANTGASGTPSDIDRWSCSRWDESGPEHIYSFSTGSDRTVQVRIADISEDLDVFIIQDNGGGCQSSNCITYGNNGAYFTASAGVTYYVVVDGYLGVTSSYHFTLTCG
ncbi:MAG: PPC domain-containing protein [Deltaproteobacteria bacterium]|nr:PPC domain-containing protein [Deltaproteobacteria bacterium]